MLFIRENSDCCFGSTASTPQYGLYLLPGPCVQIAHIAKRLPLPTRPFDTAGEDFRMFAGFQP